jgi:class 3 adenylate cyclase
VSECGSARIETLSRENGNLREQQRALSDVLRAMARSEGLDSVFDAVVEAAARLCEAEHGQVHVRDGEVFRLAGDYGSRPELLAYERSHPHVADRTSVVGRVALSRTVEHIADVLEDPDYSYPTQRAGGFRALLGVPIFLDDALIGVINLVRNQPKAFSEEQIGIVRTFADQAAIAIANARLLDAVDRQRTELSRFVSPQVAELLSNEDGKRLLAGHRAYISVLFCDLRGFTSFVEVAAPEELLELVREYHGVVGELITAYGGTLEHFAGDGVMVFFNDPVPLSDHEESAIRMAVALETRFAELAAVWRKRGTELGLGIGIASGYATLGRIGFPGRYDYGALGPVTNLASRLSTQAKPGQILISQRVHAAVEDSVDAQSVGELELKGFGRPIAAYEVTGVTTSAM